MKEYTTPTINNIGGVQPQVFCVVTAPILAVAYAVALVGTVGVIATDAAVAHAYYAAFTVAYSLIATKC
ncbi:hypothetical protein ACAG39_12460 [Caldicellulosiruptoraceae bacterium PP1]